MGCRGMERLALRRLSGKPMDLIFYVFLLRVPNAFSTVSKTNKDPQALR